MSNYKFGMCTWYLPFHGPFLLKYLKDAGYEGVQIDDYDGANRNFPLCDLRFAGEYAEAAEKYGMEIQCVNLFASTKTGLIKGRPGTEVGELWRKTVEKGCEACQLIGCNTIMAATYGPSGIQNRSDFDIVSQNLRLANQIAEDHGVTLLFESFSGVKDTLQLCSDSGAKLVYDTANPLKYGFAESGAEEILAYDLERIHTVHVKDIGSDYASDAPFGEGFGRLEESVKALKEIRYVGWVFNEHGYYFPKIPSEKKNDPWALMHEDLKRLKNIFA